MRPPTLVRLPDGRDLALDDTGDPDGLAVIHLHGVPDSRLGRHPDGALAAAAGVRLLSIDRPGCGRSSPHPGRGLASVADDVVAACDRLEVGPVGVLAWSAGALHAAALAARHPDRVRGLGLVAPMVPVTAYQDEAVRAVAGEGRLMTAEMAAELGPLPVAEEVAPYLLPDPAQPDLVREQQAADDPARAQDLAAVPGAEEALVAATVEAVALGRRGLIDEVATQVAPPDVDLGTVTAPTTVWAGGRDAVSPVAFAEWWGATLPHATVRVVPGAGHAVWVTAWADILDDLVATAH